MKKIAVVAVLLLGACSSSASGGHAKAPSRSAGPLVTGDFSNVTCGDWLAWGEEDRVAAMLVLNRRLNAFDKSVGFARIAAEDVATDCRAQPALKLTEVVAAFATLDASDYP